MTALPLVFDAPRRGKPPRHLADLTREEARAAVAGLGQPAFRADQLSRHFFRGTTDPAPTDDPATPTDGGGTGTPTPPDPDPPAADPPAPAP